MIFKKRFKIRFLLFVRHRLPVLGGQRFILKDIALIVILQGNLIGGSRRHRPGHQHRTGDGDRQTVPDFSVFHSKASYLRF